MDRMSTDTLRLMCEYMSFRARATMRLVCRAVQHRLDEDAIYLTSDDVNDVSLNLNVVTRIILYPTSMRQMDAPSCASYGVYASLKGMVRRVTGHNQGQSIQELVVTPVTAETVFHAGLLWALKRCIQPKLTRNSSFPVRVLFGRGCTG